MASPRFSMSGALRGPSAPSGLLVVALLASVLSPAISFHSSPNPFPTSTFLAAHRAACQHPKQCTSPRPSERAPASMLQSGFAGVSSSRRGRADRVLLRAVEEEQAGGVAAPGLMERQDEEQEGAAGESRYWTWREGWRIHYTEAGPKDGAPVAPLSGWRIHYTEAGPKDGAPVVLLSGFGIGASTHYDRNVEALVEAGHRVFTMDYMGQGKSWPTADPAPGGSSDQEGFEWGFGAEANTDIDGASLTYSCTLWTEQVKAFLETIVEGPAFLAGNSLGGYVSVMLASQHPEMVRGLFLINPTPVWGVGAQRLFPYSGGYPVPSWIRGYASQYWDTIRNPKTIRSMLDMVYADAGRLGEDLVGAIETPTLSLSTRHAPTRFPAAASAFASILCSPPSKVPFATMLMTVRDGDTPIALCYGKQDPWITPLWGHRAKRLLSAAPYWEISPAGHCPHHEAPEAVNFLMTRWLAEVTAGRPGTLDEDLSPVRFVPPHVH
ncbi:Alpha/Beta hydrolase protein [Baffinella frigidus]|nr:Alpha/Beta hydrolase protein [Cryptophyta sp. CCMP2293]